MTNAPGELLAVTLARIETKLDGVIPLVQDHELRVRQLEGRHDDKDHDGHELRITKLEGRRWPLPSVAIVVSVAAVIIPFVR